jgi:hypothetical protein
VLFCGCGGGGIVGFGGFGGLGGAGRVGGILRASFTAKSPKNYSILSYITACSLLKSIYVYMYVSFRQDMIISSPLSSILVSVLTSIPYTIYLFFLLCGDKCTYTSMGERYVLNESSKNLLSAKFGASITRRFSFETEILLN